MFLVESHVIFTPPFVPWEHQVLILLIAIVLLSSVVALLCAAVWRDPCGALYDSS